MAAEGAALVGLHATRSERSLLVSQVKIVDVASLAYDSKTSIRTYTVRIALKPVVLCMYVLE